MERMSAPVSQVHNLPCPDHLVTMTVERGSRNAQGTLSIAHTSLFELSSCGSSASCGSL